MKRVLVTGAAKRIGAAIVRAAAADGERLLVVGEDGSWTAGPREDAALLRAAGALAAVADERAQELPAETVEALRSLGYAE